VLDQSMQQAASVNSSDKFELVFRSLLDKLFVDRMDQNEEIFVRFMNDARFQKTVTAWMATEAYRKIRQASTNEALVGDTLPPRLRIIEPRLDDRYVICVPLVPLKLAAGMFGNPQGVDENEFEWVSVESKRPLRKGMFVAQVVGRSMEPAISDGAYCLFSAPVSGSRDGRTVLVQLRDASDPETGERYTVKRYESRKADDGDTWRHERVVLRPVNRDFEAIELSGNDGDAYQTIAELVEVLT